MKKQFDYSKFWKRVFLPNYKELTITPSGGKIVLKLIIVSSDIFFNILKTYPARVVRVQSLKPYYRGYHEKGVIVVKDDFLICTEGAIDPIHPLLDFCDWKQVIVRCDASLEPETIKRDISGGYAWNYMLRVLKRKYTPEQIEQILHSYDDIKYNSHLKQYHLINFDLGLNKYDNCYKFDVNSAHASALAEMFPLCKDSINRLYLKRKENPIYKAILNYFVGYFAHKGYRGAYNWVVQRTTRTLQSAIKETRGNLLYANTDGFIVQDPEKVIKTSKKLGEFKLEYQGTLYSYIDKNYWFYQQADNSRDKDRGNLPSVLRKHIDLMNNKVVHYTKVYNEELCTYNYINVQEEIING